MTNYQFSDSAVNEELDETGRDIIVPPLWNIQMYMNIEHPDLSNEKLGKLHDIFNTALTDTAALLEDD